MKNLYSALIIFFLVIVCNAKAQLGIGKENLSNESVLLEFGTEAKGILLPSVIETTGAAPGTFVFNTVSKSVQVLAGGNWIHLTDENQAVLHGYANAGNEVGEGVILGAEASTKPGVLVLESTTQAMVLPQVLNPHINMKGVIAGMVVYDTSADMLAVYDGANWSYWK